MTDFPAATAEASRLVLHPNRHITAVMEDGTQYHLRPPTLSKWREILAAYVVAQDTVKPPTGGDDGQGTLQRLYGGVAGDPTQEAAAPFGEAFSKVLRCCAGQTVPADELPVWAAQASIFQTLYDHWRTVDIIVENEQPDAADVPPVGHGAVWSQASELPAPPDGGESPVVVYEAPDEDVPVASPAGASSGGIGPRTPAGQARLQPTPTG